MHRAKRLQYSKLGSAGPLRPSKHLSCGEHSDRLTDLLTFSLAITYDIEIFPFISFYKHFNIFHLFPQVTGREVLEFWFISEFAQEACLFICIVVRRGGYQIHC